MFAKPLTQFIILTSGLVSVASSAVMVTSSTPEKVTGGNTLAIDLDGDGSDEVNFQITQIATAFSFNIAPGPSGVISVAGQHVPKDPIFGALFPDPTINAARRLESVLGLNSSLPFNSSQAVLASNSFFVDEADGEWSNQGGGAVSGYVGLTFEKEAGGLTFTYLGFLQVEVDESVPEATVLSFGFDNSAVSVVPEPTSMLSAMIGLLFVLRRRR